MAQSLRNEEIWICIMWKARGVMWQNAGVPIQIATPREGVGLYISEFVIPKNAPNKDGAYAFLNASLQAPAQVGFAESMGYNGSNASVELPAALQSRIALSEAERANLLVPDYEYLARADAGLRDWWERVFKA
jgi:putative spermidine/putrescine transport system substrate-binding protein